MIGKEERRPKTLRDKSADQPGGDKADDDVEPDRGPIHLADSSEPLFRK
jgi:hypothetical protein